MTRPSLLSRYSHVFLFGALLLLVGVQPFFHGALFGTALIHISLFGSLIVSGFSCAANKRQIIGFLACAGPTIAIGAIWWMTGAQHFQNTYLALSALSTLYVVVLILFDIFRTTGVSANTVFGALAVYLLMGVLWTYLYAVLEFFCPGSFNFGARDIVPGEEAKLRNLLGFSFTTLTTLGYGNITPTEPRGDALTSLEAITGQIYLTVLVARLVGIQVSQHVARQAKREA